jgi:hypothetical protein
MKTSKKEKVGFLSLSCFIGSIASLMVDPLLFVYPWPIIFLNLILIISCIACLIIYKKQNKAGTFMTFVSLCFIINALTVMTLIIDIFCY